MLTTAERVALPPRLTHFYGKVHGIPAPFAVASVDTEMDISQRKFYPEKILEYIKKHKGLNWKTFGYVTVVRYPDGSERMINGRHRTSVAITVDPTITHVPAHIVDVANEEEAAILFAAMNGESSKNLTTEELFWSTVIAKDPESLRIKAVLETCGLACGKVNEFDEDGNPNVQVKLANFKKCLNFGVDETIRIVKLIRLAYPKATAFDNLLSGATRLVTMKEYEALLDTNAPVGKDFDFWFTKILKTSCEIKDTNFRKYRNTTQWYNGVAFGLYELFSKYMKSEEKKYPSIKAIKKVYEDGISNEDE
jgi:hypothetical protein